MAKQEHILIAVLDWGLGHAGRCVPLIQEWRAAGKRVTVASSGSALDFLRSSVTCDHFLALPPYAVRYPSHSMVWNLMVQSPRLLRVMLREHRIIDSYIAGTKVDRIVSDGRFGCWHRRVESIWLAHQLQLQYSWGGVAWSMNRAYHAYLKKCFRAIWVPDGEGAKSLAGNLSRPIAGLPHRYLGPLSRFAGKVPLSSKPYTYQWLALVSGPEPQRTYLEEKLIEYFGELAVSALVVRGVKGSSTPRRLSSTLSVVDWLLGNELQAAVMQSENLVCRSGYSTLMDAHYWQKPLLLIPTPGQTEQIYLAHYWADQGWARWISDKELQPDCF